MATTKTKAAPAVSKSTESTPEPDSTESTPEPDSTETAPEAPVVQSVVVRVRPTWNWKTYQYQGRLFTKDGVIVSVDDPILPELKGHQYLEVVQ